MTKRPTKASDLSTYEPTAEPTVTLDRRAAEDAIEKATRRWARDTPERLLKELDGRDAKNYSRRIGLADQIWTALVKADAKTKRRRRSD